jgi:hypothetical protein
LAVLLCASLLVLLSVGGCKKHGSGTSAPTEAPEEKGNLYTPESANCNGFTAADAAAILGLPATEVSAETKELYPGSWQCLFDSNAGKTIAFNVSVAKSVDQASNDMEQYRSHLQTAAETSSSKENLPKGAYNNVQGLGDEAVWTDMNFSLAVREGNVTVTVSLPKDQTIQTKVAEKFLSTLKH